MELQINFFLTAEDQVAFEEHLKKAGDFVAIRWKSDKPEPAVVDLSAHTGVLSLRLVLPQHLVKVSMQPILTRREYSVDGLISPVVEYSRCPQGDRLIRRGRLYFQEGYFDSAGKWVVKDEAFITWARRLRETARRFFKKRRISFFYLGEGAEEARAEGFELSQI
jgi:hypothetical protein